MSSNNSSFPSQLSKRQKSPEHASETLLSENHDKHVIIQRQKELGNIESDNTHLETFNLSHLNKINKEYPCIPGGPWPDFPELLWVKNSVLDTVKLQSSGNHLFNKFSQSIQHTIGWNTQREE
jgi:hypothetical protein